MEKENCPARQELFGAQWTLFGCRENCRYENGVLTTKDC